MVGKGKKKAFNSLKDQVGRRIARWKGKLLSNVGREILIKAVAQVTPTYTMSCFKLPDSLCQELNTMVSSFWWGQQGSERKMAWVSWERMCTRKMDGGMGFKDLKAFNLALLAKQGWRLLQTPSSLIHKVYKARYFKNSSFMEAKLGRNPSYAWRSILAARDVLQKGMRWIIGNGKKVKIWDYKWLPTPISFKVCSPRRQGVDLEVVANLLDGEKGMWNIDKVKSIFLPHEANMVLGIPISPCLPDDSLIWAWTNNGRFKVRSAYGVALQVLKEGQQNRDKGNSLNISRMSNF